MQMRFWHPQPDPAGPMLGPPPLYSCCNFRASSPPLAWTCMDSKAAASLVKGLAKLPSIQKRFLNAREISRDNRHTDLSKLLAEHMAPVTNSCLHFQSKRCRMLCHELERNNQSMNWKVKRSENRVQIQPPAAPKQGTACPNDYMGACTLESTTCSNVDHHSVSMSRHG